MLTACQGPPTTVMNFSPFVACGPAALISPGTNTVNMVCVCVCVCVCVWADMVFTCFSAEIA